MAAAKRQPTPVVSVAKVLADHIEERDLKMVWVAKQIGFNTTYLYTFLNPAKPCYSGVRFRPVRFKSIARFLSSQGLGTFSAEDVQEDFVARGGQLSLRRVA